MGPGGKLGEASATGSSQGMAAGRGSVPRAGLRNTLRFVWRDAGEPKMTWEVFARRVVVGSLKLSVAEVLCLQDNAQERAYDLTMQTEGLTAALEARCRAQGKEQPLSSFEVVNLSRPNLKVITVHLYNPHVPDSAISGFLGRYGEVLSGARYVRGAGGLGFWNGRRQFQVLLGEDPAGLDGLKHPPAYFALGADRGYLFYPRQPPCCRRCRGVGHTESTCGGARCRDCGKDGHVARDCTAAKTCHGCGQPGHLFRECQVRGRSYAGVVGGAVRAPRQEGSEATAVVGEEARGSGAPDAGGATDEAVGAVREAAMAAAAAAVRRGEALRPLEVVLKEVREDVRVRGDEAVDPASAVGGTGQGQPAPVQDGPSGMGGTDHGRGLDRLQEAMDAVQVGPGAPAAKTARRKAGSLDGGEGVEESPGEGHSKRAKGVVGQGPVGAEALSLPGSLAHAPEQLAGIEAEGMVPNPVPASWGDLMDVGEESPSGESEGDLYT